MGRQCCENTAALRAEIARLRAEVEQRRRENKRLREELDRLKRALCFLARQVRLVQVSAALKMQPHQPRASYGWWKARRDTAGYVLDWMWRLGLL